MHMLSIDMLMKKERLWMYSGQASRERANKVLVQMVNKSKYSVKNHDTVNEMNLQKNSHKVYMKFCSA